MLTETLTAAFKYCDENGIEVPLNYRTRFYNAAFKGLEDLAVINSGYHDVISEVLIGYFEGGIVTGFRNRFRVGATEAFYDAFYQGYRDAGGIPPIPPEGSQWLEARINQEYGFIDALFSQIKELRKDPSFEFFGFVNDKADGYTAALREVYNTGALYAMGNKMLTFDGDDGSAQHVCQSINGTCVRLKGKRHRASWWLAHDLMPYRGNRNYDCGGWNCQHYLIDDEGNRVTI